MPFRHGPGEVVGCLLLSLGLKKEQGSKRAEATKCNVQGEGTATCNKECTAPIAHLVTLERVKPAGMPLVTCNIVVRDAVCGARSQQGVFGDGMEGRRRSATSGLTPRGRLRDPLSTAVRVGGSYRRAWQEGIHEDEGEGLLPKPPRGAGRQIHLGRQGVDVVEGVVLPLIAPPPGGLGPEEGPGSGHRQGSSRKLQP